MIAINKFFKEIKRLKDLERKITRQKGVWPFGWSHECIPEDCFKRPDGLWEQREKTNAHLHHGGETVVFIWRVEPNYCIHGQPVVTHDRVLQYLVNSETEKLIVAEDGYEFFWKWDEVKRPTSTCWGMGMGKPYYEMRKDGNVLIQTQIKAEFLRQYINIS